MERDSGLSASKFNIFCKFYKMCDYVNTLLSPSRNLQKVFASVGPVAYSQPQN